MEMEPTFQNKGETPCLASRSHRYKNTDIHFIYLFCLLIFLLLVYSLTAAMASIQSMS